MNDITKVNVPRFVESANARLEIRRDDSHAQNQKRKDRGEADHAPVEWDEMATVSVMALYAFLGSLLASRLHHDNPPPAFVPAEHQPKTLQQKQAMGAYHRVQSRGGAVDTNTGDDALPPSDPSIVLADDVSDDDVRRMQQYRHDLMELNRRGVAEIRLERAENFLTAIGEGIKAVL